MKTFKKQIFQLLEDNTIDETSSTGRTGERIIYAPYNDIVNEIVKIVSYNFEHKNCMTEGIKSREEHEKYVKDLEHHKDTTIGLYATDKEIGDLLYLFWQRKSDACPLEVCRS